MVLAITLVFSSGCEAEEVIEPQVEIVAAEEIEPVEVIEDQEEDPIIFNVKEIDEGLKARMEGVSYHENDVIGWSDLRLVQVTHIGFDDKIHYGELIVHKVISEDVKAIFQDLYDAQFPIEKIVPVSVYDGDDNLSMADNNSSAFNYRLVSGTNKLSNHSYGLAIDINPLINPYVTKNGVYPKEGKTYVERDPKVRGLIVKGDPCYQAFIERGFIWGGEWQSVKDYQHFEIKIEGINE